LTASCTTDALVCVPPSTETLKLIHTSITINFYFFLDQKQIYFGIFIEAVMIKKNKKQRHKEIAKNEDTEEKARQR